MAARGPQFVNYFGPVLRALDRLGGSARPAEVRDVLAEELAVPDAERDAQLKGGQSRFDNRVAWARFYLAKAGLIDASARGVWALTEAGRDQLGMDHDAAMKLFRAVHQQFQGKRGQEVPGPGDDETAPAGDDAAPAEAEAAAIHYRDAFLEALQRLTPAGFERFCRRLLLESGFQQVEVTGKAGDGGIDGIGLLQVNRLVSAKVLFQCKRYVGTVGPDKVRDFRGAMMGRSENGIMITTGTFSAEARRESVRDGVPPIELVDGQRIIELCEALELGLRPVRTFELDRRAFAEWDPAPVHGTAV